MTTATDGNVTLHIRDLPPGNYDIAWGDGQTLPGMSYTPSPDPVSFSHTYADGTYTLTVTDALATVHSVVVKVPVIKARITSGSHNTFADDPPHPVNVVGTFDGSQKAYVDGVEQPTTGVSATTFTFQVTPGTFPAEEGTHYFYGVQADGSRTNGQMMTVFP